MAPPDTSMPCGPGKPNRCGLPRHAVWGWVAPGRLLKMNAVRNDGESCGPRQKTWNLLFEGSALPALIVATWRSPLLAPPHPGGRLVGVVGESYPSARLDEVARKVKPSYHKTHVPGVEFVKN